VAAAFSAAIQGDATASSFLTAATFNTTSVIGPYGYYHHHIDSNIVTSVANAAGVTTTMREWRRTFEPSQIGFERVIAQDPVYQNALAISAIGSHRTVNFTFKDCVLGAYSASYIWGPGANGTYAANSAFRDRVMFNFENTVFDIRDASFWTNLELMLYAGHFRGCRVRTPTVATGLTTMGTGYETLVSEDGGVYTGTPGAGVTTVDIQTKLFWVPKDGNVRIYPADAATAVVWNTNMPSISWVKSHASGGLVGTYSALVGSYYGTSEDRRAPALRLTFATAPATALAIGWAAAVSP
jgi:hypothetical protein